MQALPMPLIREALNEAQRLGVARLDAQLLLLHVLTTVAAAEAAGAPPTNITRSWLLSHDDRALAPQQVMAWAAALKRRAGGEPLAYVVGAQEFCGLRLGVSPAVLIPRPETEGLVQWALERLRATQQPQPRVLDLGTGSGAIALAIKHRCPHATVWASDISPAALAVAAANAQGLQLNIHCMHANWWAAPEGGTTGADACANGVPTTAAAFETAFDLVVSNPPYIARGDDHLAALRHEPRNALVGADDDGLGDLRRIVSGSRPRLAPGAWLLLEHGHDQAAALQALLLQAGYEAPQTRPDLAGLPRCTGARWPMQPAREG